MQAAIAADELIAESAFHEAVRLRHPAGLTALTTHGISHIELRMLDLDPTVTTGIRSDTLLLVQLLAFYFMVTPKLAATELMRQHSKMTKWRWNIRWQLAASNRLV